MVESICAAPIRRGERKGQPATGTWAGYMRHRRAGEDACEPCLQALRDDYAKKVETNPHHARDQSRRYREANPGLREKHDRLYRERHPEKVREASRRWREKPGTKERQTISAREWKRANREKARASYHRWAKAHPDRARLRVAERKARLAAATTVDFTEDQLTQRMSMFGFRCWMCGGDYDHNDHVIAIARGGPHCLANLRPACESCNCSKGAKDWRLFVPRKEVA